MTLRNLLKVHGSDLVLARGLGNGYTCKDHGVLKEGVDLEMIFSPRLNGLVAACSACLENEGMEIITSAVLVNVGPPERWPRPCPLCGETMGERLAEHLATCKGNKGHAYKSAPPGVCSSAVCGERVEKICSTCHAGFCGAHVSLGGKEGAPTCFACQRKLRTN
jgi:hypothetical protein